MVKISVCPETSDLNRFASGRLPLSEMAALVEHLESCAACTAKLPTLPTKDTLVDALATVQALVDGPDDPILARLIDRLAKLERPRPAASGAASDRQTVLPVATPEATECWLEHGADGARWDFLGAPERPDEIGRLGAYRVLQVLGAGGMGVVFRAEIPLLERSVALKAMLPALAAIPSARKRFLREAKAAAALKHDHIVAIYQVGEDRGVPFLAMELLEGEPLDQCLQREGKLPLADTLRIGREIAEGLAAAHHKGLIHRDIKPANIWLENRGVVSGGVVSGKKTDRHHSPLTTHHSPFRVKILDFGLARAPSQEAGLTQAGAILGTPAYMAPEQGRGENVDARCDLFSLGVVLYRLCTGRAPFHGNDTVSTLMAVALDEPALPATLNAEVPHELSDLVMKLLAKNPADRPAAADDVVHALQRMEKTLARNDPPAQATVKPRPPAGRRPIFTAIAAALFLVMLFVSGAGTWVLMQMGVIRFSTEQGDFVVDTDDPDLSFKVHKGVVTLMDERTKRPYKLRVINQPTGKFKLEVTDPTGGLNFQTESFTIKRGDTIALKAWFEPKQLAGATLLDDAWIKEVANMLGPQKVEAIKAKLSERNPGFNGKIESAIDGRVVTELTFSADKITDLSPLRALPGLQALYCEGLGFEKPAPLADLTPLKGLKLTLLAVSHTQVSDLAPLKDMPLTTLGCENTLVANLAPLKGMKLLHLWAGASRIASLAVVEDMPLHHLTCFGTPVADLTPLRKMMTLRGLHIGGTKVTDLSPLKDLALTGLDLDGLKVSNLTPLKDLKLTELHCSSTQVTDLTPLQNMKLIYLDIDHSPVADLTPLKGMKLETLYLSGTKVTDLKALGGMPLKLLSCDFNARDAEILRSIKTLEKLNGKPAAEVLK